VPAKKQTPLLRISPGRARLRAQIILGIACVILGIACAGIPRPRRSSVRTSAS
jgi:hypothetical protein